MQRCARCGEEFAPVRFIQDLKKTLNDVGENYNLQRTADTEKLVQPQVDVVDKTTEAIDESTKSIGPIWWQDICPTCKRVMRAEANLAALGKGGNQFL